MPQRFSFRSRLRSVAFAWRGVRLVMIGQQNAWIHFAFTIAAIAAGFFFRISRLEWCAIVLAMMAVWTAEALNTALELLCDVATTEFHPLVEKAKDVAAGAVLFSALGSVVVGVLVFLPHLFPSLK